MPCVCDKGGESFAGGWVGYGMVLWCWGGGGCAVREFACCEGVRGGGGGVLWVSQFGIVFFNSRGNGSGHKIAPESYSRYLDSF